jgi:hypothetical protein
MLTETQILAIKPVRYERRVTDGQGLYLLVTPKGALHWRFRYRFAGKCKTLALGSYPWLLSIGPGHVTSLFVTYSPMESILRR